MPFPSNTVGFDDAPFAPDHQGSVRLVGCGCSRTRLDGVVSGWVQRDGDDATDEMVSVLRRSQFLDHVQAVLLQGIAVAGFNVVDAHRLHETLGLPVLVIARRMPDFAAMQTYLQHNVANWETKWQLVRGTGALEAIRGVHVQRIGLSRAETGHLLAATTLHGRLPEPLRLAHLIAGGVTTGASRGRA